MKNLIPCIAATLLLSASATHRDPPAPEANGGACYASVELAVAPEARPVRAADARERVLIEHLARRYQVAREALERVVVAAHAAAAGARLDPLLVLAVIGVESGFNPVAASPMGAKGLMQIIPKYHQEKLLPHGGEAAVLDPVANVKVGTQILKEYVRMTGTLEAGLQFYNGAAWDASARYAQKVMEERSRLEQAIAATSSA